MLFHAFRAKAMGEFGFRMFRDILFETLPALLIIADLVAMHADRQ